MSSQPRAVSSEPGSYWLQKFLGSGSFGEVYLANRRGNGISEDVAVKIVRYSPGAHHHSPRIVQNVRTEVAILSMNQSPYIVRFIRAFWVSVSVTEVEFYVVMEYCPNKTLYDLVDQCRRVGVRMPEKCIRQIIAPITMGVEYLNTKRIVDRDVKSLNVVFDSNGIAKLVDFSLARSLLNTPNGKLTSRDGTPHYQPPEIHQSVPYDDKVDVWPLGIIVYEMAEVHIPHPCLNANEVGDAICSNHAPMLSDMTHWSTEMVNFLELCCQKDPTKRPDSTFMSKHPFVSQEFASQERCESPPRSTPVMLLMQYLNTFNGGPDLNYVDEDRTATIKAIVTLAGLRSDPISSLNVAVQGTQDRVAHTRDGNNIGIDTLQHHGAHMSAAVTLKGYWEEVLRHEPYPIDLYLWFAQCNEFRWERTLEAMWGNRRYLGLSISIYETATTLASFPILGLTSSKGHSMFYVRPVGMAHAETALDQVIYTMLSLRWEMLHGGIGVIINMTGFTKSDADIAFIERLVAVLRGELIPVRVGLVLLLDPPSDSISTCHFASEELRNKVRVATVDSIKFELTDGHERLLPNEVLPGGRSTDEILSEFIGAQRSLENASRMSLSSD